MSLIQKDYYRLDDVAQDLELPASDVLYLAENGQLRLTIRVFNLSIERGFYEHLGDGHRRAVADHYGHWTGLLDLLERDAHEILKRASADVISFHEPEGRYCHCWGLSESIRVTPLDLLVRHTERQRLETILGRSSPGIAAVYGQAVPGFTHEPDYRIVRHGGELYSLGTYQAAVVKHLHRAALAGHPWCKGVDILAEIECSTLRMSDLFKSKRGWRQLIESNTRGMYRLAVNAQD